MISYRIEPLDLHAHLFRVSVRITEPAAEQRVSLPVWIPGSYLVREFQRHLQRLSARQGSRALNVEQLDKASWLLRCQGRAALELSYEVYAFDTSVRAAFLDATRGFFNGTGVFLRVEGREQEPQRLEIRGLPRGWKVATALPAVQVDARGQGAYEAADYDELVDQPVELGDFWRAEFRAGGVVHELVVAGALPGFDGERLLKDTRRICEAQIAFWHGRKRPPFKRYVFLLNAAEDNYGGLEHRASTALICSRRDLPREGDSGQSDGYVTLLGLISHEYFHTWNVKRLRPVEFARYDYTQENYTRLLWFFEGFTSYYDDLFLVRTGLIDEARYMKLLGKTIGGVLATPGRQLQSVAQASYDAWIRYYRQDENSVNSTVSYYTKGSLVALALDLQLRSEGRGSLDEVMLELWRRSSGGPVSEADISAALEQVSGRSYEDELARWVHGTADLPLPALLQAAAIAWKDQPAPLAQRLGLRSADGAGGVVQVKAVVRGGAAEQAGLAAGDELLAVNDWRLRKLEDLPLLAAPGGPLELLVARDQRLLRLRARLPDAESVQGPVMLGPAAQAAPEALALREAWLGRR
ncbi:PDZ domain-containing protein [Aquabacterium sp. A7-Y]|uniref:M61 family metallopeptidase n=1 Tax=Aquabacterium sp. A7-Y TaxID=1349605 RepID=UPI00223DA5B4|nr:PDZ domain-containing protein [Aquabacterium sp. A7-Y]MCW7537058.1 PDZ domain-containing protein [Aquabacterium sp. A7-Y]